MNSEINNMSDHDLLITLHEQIKNIRADIKDIKDGTSLQLSDHELRLRRIELWGAIAFGATWATEFYLQYIRK